jgi:hypothetical protein
MAGGGKYACFGKRWLNIGGRIGKPADREQCQAACKMRAQRRSAATLSTVNKNYLPLLCAFREGRLSWRPLSWLESGGPSERLLNGSAATNSTPSLAEVATIHSTVYSPRVPVGDGLRSVYIYRNTA